MHLDPSNAKTDPKTANAPMSIFFFLGVESSESEAYFFGESTTILAVRCFIFKICYKLRSGARVRVKL